MYCVVPPYVLSAIAEHGTDEQKRWALNTTSHDQTFRMFRSTVAAASRGQSRFFMQPASGPSRRRIIFDAAASETLPGRLARSEGESATGDVAVDEAYDGLGSTFDYFWSVHHRNALDGVGGDLRATVHYGQSYQNAFWNGRQMVFGDGDGQLFQRFTRSLDVIAHELGHGVTEVETALAYMFQPGALNEHLSDVWGTLVKQWTLNQSVDAADWLIGADLLGPAVQGDALRSMSNPGSAFDDPILGRDPQPGHMDNFAVTWHDNGGVHINSGIPNRAFYLAAMAIGGRAWEKSGQIWYAAMLDSRVKEDTDFARFARVTIDAAVQIPSSTSGDVAAVTDAWAQVGVAPA